MSSGIPFLGLLITRPFIFKGKKRTAVECYWWFLPYIVENNLSKACEGSLKS